MNWRPGTGWHVYGMLHRNEKNWTEAARCFQIALRSDPTNVRLLGDLAQCQVQIRDYPGFLVCATPAPGSLVPSAATQRSRHALLTSQPTSKPNWLGFIIALELAGQVPRALDACTTFLGTLAEVFSFPLFLWVELRERGRSESTITLNHATLYARPQGWTDVRVLVSLGVHSQSCQ